MPAIDEADAAERELLFKALATLDTRPEHRAVALPFVRNRLRDAARADWLETSLARDNQLLAADSWVATLGRHVGPKAVRSEVLLNPIASRVTQSALQWLGDAKDSAEVGPIFADLWQRRSLRTLVYVPYASYLAGREDYPAAEQLARQYLVEPASDFGSAREVATAHLAASVRRQGRQQEAWQTIEPALAGQTAAAYHEGLMTLVDLGRYDNAESLGRTALERYPNDAELRAGIAVARWRAGRSDDAARDLDLGEDRFATAVAHFGYAFHDGPPKAALDAFNALLRRDDPGHALRSRAAAIPAWFDENGRHDVAHALYARLELVGEAWQSLRADKGDDAAARWVASLSLPPDAAPRFFAAGAFELLWGAFPERSTADTVWMLRAAAVARDAETARRHGAEVRAHFDRVARSKEEYLARVILGIDREAAQLRGKLGPADLCDVSWAFGLAAQARQDLPEAVDSYEVAASTGEAARDCFRNARRQLDEWRRKDVPFDRSWSAKPAEVAAAQ